MGKRGPVNINDPLDLSYRFLAVRAHSEFEIVSKLKMRNFSDLDIEKVTLLLKEKGLLDDLKYAKEFATLKVAKGNIGTLRLKDILYRKGISTDIVEKVTKEIYTENKEERIAIRAASRFVNNKDKIKLFKHLLSKGFSYNLVRDLVENKMI